MRKKRERMHYAAMRTLQEQIEASRAARRDTAAAIEAATGRILDRLDALAARLPADPKSTD